MAKKKILLNAFNMNAVGHINHGLWTHPRDRSAQYTDLEQLGFWFCFSAGGSGGEALGLASGLLVDEERRVALAKARPGVFLLTECVDVRAGCAAPNHFSRFPSQNPFVDRRFRAVYHDSHLIWREAMTCPTCRCPR